jgi:hypothetical protein
VTVITAAEYLESENQPLGLQCDPSLKECCAGFDTPQTFFHADPFKSRAVVVRDIEGIKTILM